VAVFPTLGDRFWNYPYRDLHTAAVESARESGLLAVRTLLMPATPTKLRVLITVLAHPKSWVVIGVFYPKKRPVAHAARSLFD